MTDDTETLTIVSQAFCRIIFWFLYTSCWLRYRQEQGMSEHYFCICLLAVFRRSRILCPPQAFSACCEGQVTKLTTKVKCTPILALTYVEWEARHQEEYWGLNPTLSYEQTVLGKRTSISSGILMECSQWEKAGTKREGEEERKRCEGMCVEICREQSSAYTYGISKRAIEKYVNLLINN